MHFFFHFSRSNVCRKSCDLSKRKWSTWKTSPKTTQSNNNWQISALPDSRMWFRSLGPVNFFYARTHICNLLGIMHTLKFRHHTKETKVVKSRNDHCIEEMETTLKSLMNERERSEQTKIENYLKNNNSITHRVRSLFLWFSNTL